MVKLSKQFVDGACQRVHEQKVSTEADIRELIAYLRYEMNKAALEGREVVVELWTDYVDPPIPKLQIVEV